MKRVIFGLVLGGALCSAVAAHAQDGDTPPPAPPPPPAAPPPPRDELASQLGIWTVLSASAGQIDACTARYTSEFPDRKGEARISVKVIEGGRVQDATATSELPSSDRLTTCLSSVGRLWRFAEGPMELALPVQVAKGLKLRLKKPGEKDPPPAAPPSPGEAPKTDGQDGFIRFTPSWEQ